MREQYWLIKDGSGHLPDTVWAAENRLEALLWFEDSYPNSWAVSIERCNPGDGEMRDPFQILGVYDMLPEV